MSIDPLLIRAEAQQIQGVPLSESRAREIAGEVDSLIAGLERVLDAVGLFDGPDGFRAVLWELREQANERS